MQRLSSVLHSEAADGQSLVSDGHYHATASSQMQGFMFYNDDNNYFTKTGHFMVKEGIFFFFLESRITQNTIMTLKCNEPRSSPLIFKWIMVSVSDTLACLIAAI